MTAAACRSCEAPIVWCVSEKSRKRMPLDATPRPDGNLLIVDGLAVALRTTDPRREADEIEKYVSHHATCPQADSWRTRKPSPDRRSNA